MYFSVLCLFYMLSVIEFNLNTVIKSIKEKSINGHLQVAYIISPYCMVHTETQKKLFRSIMYFKPIVYFKPLWNLGNRLMFCNISLILTKSVSLFQSSKAYICAIHNLDFVKYCRLWTTVDRTRNLVVKLSVACNGKAPTWYFIVQ